MLSLSGKELVAEIPGLAVAGKPLASLMGLASRLTQMESSEAPRVFSVRL